MPQAQSIDHANLPIQENVSLTTQTTFGLELSARYFCEVSSIEQLLAVLKWAQDNNICYFLLGGGSNTIFADNFYDGLVIKVVIFERQMIEQDDQSVLIEVGAGEIWDEIVAWSVAQGWSGLELLSAIPGRCGGAPVQNIGAYGQELGNIFVSLEAIDTTTMRSVRLSKADCEFAYRTSIFKSHRRGRYIVTTIRLRLSKSSPPMPAYRDLVTLFAEQGITRPTVQQIRQAVIAIRQAKLPDPKTIPNVGSFFKNPIITKDQLDRLLQRFPQLDHPRVGWSQKAYWAVDDEHAKISAAWLIEESGLKGYTHKHVKVDDKHALILENTGQAQAQELLELRDLIINKVFDNFTIKLEVEPDIVSSITSKTPK